MNVFICFSCGYSRTFLTSLAIHIGDGQFCRFHLRTMYLFSFVGGKANTKCVSTWFDTLTVFAFSSFSLFSLFLLLRRSDSFHYSFNNNLSSTFLIFLSFTTYSLLILLSLLSTSNLPPHLLPLLIYSLPLLFPH